MVAGQENGQPQQDYKKIIEFVMTHAEAVVLKGEHLVPVGAAVRADGQVEANAAMPDDSGFANTLDVERMLIAGLRKDVKSGKYRSTGIALEMKELRREGRASVPAIKIILESILGVPAFYYQPFRRRLFRKPQFERPIMIPGKAVVLDENAELS